MVERAEEDRFNWRLPIYAAVSASLVFLSLVIWSYDFGDLFYLFVLVPIASIVLIISVFRSRGHRRLSVLSMLIIFWVISWGMIRHTYDLRTMGRWVLWSSEYKAQVLAQPVNDGLRHAEWDGWGFAGSDTVVYVVFDPTNSLAGAAKSRAPGKFKGIPCEVSRVRRLESQWYSVVFYTDTDWKRL